MIRRTLSRKGKKGYDVIPIGPPTLRHRRIFLAPVAGLEFLQSLHAGFRVLGTLDRAQRRHDRFAVLPGDELQGLANQMYDAGLHHGLGKDSPSGRRRRQ